MDRVRFARRDRRSRLTPAASAAGWGRFPSSPGSLSRFRIRAAALAALAVLVSGFDGGALAQTQTAVCSNTPGDGQRVVCEELENNNAIDLDLDGITISTTADQDAGKGVIARKVKVPLTTGTGGTGDIEIHFTNGSITTTGGATEAADGIHAWHDGTGKVVIHIRDSTFNTVGNGVAAVGNGDVVVQIRGSSITASGNNGWSGVLGQINGAGDLDIDVKDTDIAYSGPRGNGIQGFSDTTGNGKLGIRVEGGSITASGDGAVAVLAAHEGTGGIDIHIRGSTVKATGGRDSNGLPARGIYGWRTNSGDLGIRVEGGSSITSTGSGIFGLIWDSTNGDVAGDIDIDVVGSTVSTLGEAPDGTTEPWAHGIWARRGPGAGTGKGSINLRVHGSTVTTAGDGAYGITAWDQSSPPDENRHIRIEVRDSTITTTGDGGRGINVWRANGAGDIDIDVAGSTVSTSGDAYQGYVPWGISVLHRGTAGNVTIKVRDGSKVTTEGADVHGIYADRIGGDGDIVIIVEGSTVTASGAAAHGIRARGQETGAIHIVIRNSVVRATGAGSDGIRVEGGGFDAAGNRKQTVTVGSEVWGSNSGIFLAGGGRVVIGPHGRIGADSGIAIMVSGANEHLIIDLRPEGRPLDLESVLAGEISNPDGTTQLTVNGVTVFSNPAGGAMNVWVPNGAWDVRATGTDLSTLAFTQRFAPRAAVYEALPGVLLRLDAPGAGMGGDTLLRSTHTPMWARITGGMGSYEAENATAGARYDYDRYGVESGMDFPLGHGLTGWAGVRLVSGSATVSAPTGGGRIEARGMGLIAGLAWEGEDGLYGRGRLSLTRYTADLISETRGGLKNGASALVHALDLEGGRRFGLDLAGRKTRLTARGLLRRSGVTLAEFDDGLFSRVSIEEANRLTAAAGVDMETGLLPQDGVDRLRLRGSLDAEQVLSGGTKVDVLGTALESKAGGTRLGAGFGGAYRMDGYTIGGAVGAGGLGSGDTSWSARLDARIAF